MPFYKVTVKDPYDQTEVKRVWGKNIRNARNRTRKRFPISGILSVKRFKKGDMNTSGRIFIS